MRGVQLLCELWGEAMMRAYERLLRLYPDDTRFAYGSAFLNDFALGCAAARGRSRLSLLWFVMRQTGALVVDVAMDRINALYSHRSFHGPGRPNPGVVRPPNMGKKEWFDTAE
jgi:hypothetical protein